MFPALGSDRALESLPPGAARTVVLQCGGHSDSFSRLCAASARSISAAINRQFLRPALETAFPGLPVLVKFELAPEPVDDRKQMADFLSALNAAGWMPSAETVSEMMNFEVQRIQQPPTAPNTQVPPVMNRGDAPGSESPSGRFLRRGDSASEEEDSVESPAESEPPLNEGELEALRALGAGIAPEQLAADAAFMAEAMRESTIDELRSTKSDNAALRADGEEENVEEPGSESPVESVTNVAVRVFKRDNLGRFAVTGAVLKKNKGGRSSRGKKMLSKTGSPNLLEAGDSKRKTKRALVKAFDKVKDGKKVSTGYKMGNHEVTLAPGDEELAAFAEMLHPNPERMAQHLASVEAKLRGAADLPEDGGEVENKKGMYSATCRAKDKARCRTHGYTARYKAATGAVRQVMASKQDFQAAVEVPGLGEIDFPYGRPGTHEKNEKGATHEDGYGLSHIEDKHGTRALHRMPYVLAHGKVEPHPDASKRVIRHGSEIAVVRKGQQGRWELVTSYDENKNSHRDDLGISSTTEEERKARK